MKYIIWAILIVILQFFFTALCAPNSDYGDFVLSLIFIPFTLIVVFLFLKFNFFLKPNSSVIKKSLVYMSVFVFYFYMLSNFLLSFFENCSIWDDFMNLDLNEDVRETLRFSLGTSFIVTFLSAIVNFFILINEKPIISLEDTEKNNS
jgi:hypothetical protein